MYYTERLKELREDNDLTQEQFAEAVGLKREQYRRYETGINEIKASHIIKFAKFYNVSCDYLLGLSDDKNELDRDFDILLNDAAEINILQSPCNPVAENQHDFFQKIMNILEKNPSVHFNILFTNAEIQNGYPTELSALNDKVRNSLNFSIDLKKKFQNQVSVKTYDFLSPYNIIQIKKKNTASLIKVDIELPVTEKSNNNSMIFKSTNNNSSYNAYSQYFSQMFYSTLAKEVSYI